MVEGVDEQCHHSEDHAVERQELLEIGSKEAAPVDAEKKTQEEARLHKVVEPTSKPVQHEILQQVSNTESKSDISRSHCEGVLDQLFSRVNRIEDLLLRFEESMLKPINSIDVRLQQVEKQLDFPEFSNYDDEVEDHAVELVKESPKVKENHVVSIDDALAYAPAGFLSSCSMWSQKYSQTVAVKAPDFPTEDTNEKVVPLMVESELNIDPIIYFSECDGT
ncbi:40S RIBOSOMAL PROTEIN S27 [Salix purpurea]|uniref:40S RIBOSOMAL PROTEIN S27 n=1 Tax=Salix purpurea TaxID=77065 RepID=A0A9Q0PPQ5_SALPP|nr:40S RIBOSOMAL PROTEIN S27 [Salix purpurea]